MNLIKSTGTFSIFVIISRILGYLRDVLIAIYLGSGPIADAFFVAFRIPNTFRRLFAEGSFNAAFVPSYTSELTRGKVKAESFLDVCKQMMRKFPNAKKVITTLRGSISASHNTWAGVMYDGNKMYKSCEYQITDIVDRVGGGDSFMGGLIYGLIKYKNNNQKALDFAVAASCLKHTIKGDANLVSVSEVEKLMGGDASGRVSR